MTDQAAGAGRRAVALLLGGEPAVGGCPPGVAAGDFARALAEDVADLLTELPGLDPVVGFTPVHREVAEAITWPGTRLLPLAADAGPLALLAALHDLGYQQAAVLAADVPDLPGLLIAKVFSGLAGAVVGVVPALPAGRPDLAPLARGAGRPGGLAVLGCRLPAPTWLTADRTDLDAPDAVARLRAAAPHHRDLVVTPAWRRLRAPADLAGLDPGLEGWEATRALLSGR
ncbi:MAG TPA: hypothetical protein VMU51_10610 [Mycobacteriales bacterium]|nr:hypothetical protein [Mycobacteriales bacterium]